MGALHKTRQRRLPTGLLGLAACMAFGLAGAAMASDTTQAEVQTSQAQLGDAAIVVRWQFNQQHLQAITVQDRINARQLPILLPFGLQLADGTQLGLADLVLQGPVRVEDLPLDPASSSQVGRLPGKALVADLADPAGRFAIQLRWLQRDDAQYLREEVKITALKQDQAISRVHLLQTQTPNPQIIGHVDGSPVVDGPDYFGFEHPLSSATVGPQQLDLWLARSLPLQAGQSVTYSAVLGSTRPTQLRRDFLAYLERERAHPYRTFLHYNSWYDIGYFTPYTEAQALDRIHAFGEQLNRQRHVAISSFLFDDGWDDRSGSWNFSHDFPHGFVPLRDAAAAYGAAPGVWLSPWGGYSKPKQQRVAAGQAQGYEIIDGGLALSGPRYYQRFHDVTLQLVTGQGINQFKFDGTGNANQVFPGSRFDSDFSAAIALIGDLRKAKPDLYINLTTGTTPSPFWLRYADSIWRGGEDDMLAGVGSKREQWITYRDQQTYQNIVLQGPLFPLSSLMLHGIIYAQMNHRLNSDPGHDFGNEVHSYFGTGTQLQELYITPSLLTKSDWDMLAEAANWSHANADVLKDTHWIGGDPGKLQIYGWAAWSPRKGIVTLRNPSDHVQTIALNLAQALQLPPAAAQNYQLSTRWGGAHDALPAAVTADAVQTWSLQPFEVRAVELSPQP